MLATPIHCGLVWLADSGVSCIEAGDAVRTEHRDALELEWVLRSRYRFDTNSVLQAFNALLETQELEFQAEDALERALHAYRQGAAEFADCLHAGLCAAADRAPLLTFDEKAARQPGIELIKA